MKVASQLTEVPSKLTDCIVLKKVDTIFNNNPAISLQK
jgi:hypothetical protein